MFTLALLAALGYFEARDGRPPTYDDAWYLETSLRIYNPLVEGRLIEVLYQYVGAFGGSKAPLISVLPAPFYLLFGRDLDPTFLVNGFFLLLSSFCLYRLASEWFEPAVGFSAVAIFQTFPVVAGLSRYYMTEYALTALVLAFLYCLQRLQRQHVAWLVGVLLGLGLLMKILFPAFIAGPLLLAGFRRPRALATVVLVGALVASSWYLLHIKTVLGFAWGNAFGSIGDDYRAGGLWGWLRDHLAGQGLSLYYSLLIATLIPLAAALKRDFPKKPAAMMAAWFLPAAIPLVIAQSAVIRLTMPVLPALAIALAWAICSLSGPNWRRPVALAVVLAYPVIGFARIALGDRPGKPYQATYWHRPPDNEGQWNQLRIFEALPDDDEYQVILGVEHRYLNANLLNYLVHRERAPFYFRSLGYAETSTDRALAAITEHNPRFILMAEGFDPAELPAFLNQVNDGVRTALESGNLPFRHESDIRLNDRITLNVWQQIAP